MISDLYSFKSNIYFYNYLKALLIYLEITRQPYLLMILLTIQIEVKFKTLQENIFAKSLDLSKNWTQGENMPHLHY